MFYKEHFDICNMFLQLKCKNNIDLLSNESYFFIYCTYSYIKQTFIQILNTQYCKITQYVFMRQLAFAGY